MTSLFMGHLFTGEVPAQEAVVRATTAPVSHDKPAAVAPDMPEQGEFQSDPDPTLGMVGRQLASAWHEGIHVDAGQQAPSVARATESTTLINQQVSTAGTAAARELAGATHRTLSYAVGIEPVGDLRSNGAFGETYFKRTDRDIQEGAGDYMTVPPGYSADAATRAANLGTVASRNAAEGSIYDTFWNGGK